jgi:hypothetical protein
MIEYRLMKALLDLLMDTHDRKNKNKEIHNFSILSLSVFPLVLSGPSF